MPKSQKRWIYAPRKQAPPAVPAALKREVQEKANALVETELKPLHVTPPPEDPQFNYIEDLSTRWRGGFFYFFALYRSAGPGALGGQFESEFARACGTPGASFSIWPSCATPESGLKWTQVWTWTPAWPASATTSGFSRRPKHALASIACGDGFVLGPH